MNDESRRAKDKAEHDEAMRIAQWIRARAMEKGERGHLTAQMILLVSANTIANMFQLPAAGDDLVAEKIGRAVEILRSRGIDAVANPDSVGVLSGERPTYVVRHTERKTWTAEEIADDVERIERDAAPMPGKEES